MRYTSLRLCFVPYVGVLLAHADHDTLMSRTANDRGEDGPRGIVSGESGLAHSRAIVHHESSHVVVAHLCLEGERAE